MSGQRVYFNKYTYIYSIVLCGKKAHFLIHLSPLWTSSSHPFFEFYEDDDEKPWLFTKCHFFVTCLYPSKFPRLFLAQHFPRFCLFFYTWIFSSKFSFRICYAVANILEIKRITLRQEKFAIVGTFFSEKKYHILRAFFETWCRDCKNTNILKNKINGTSKNKPTTKDIFT